MDGITADKTLSKVKSCVHALYKERAIGEFEIKIFYNVSSKSNIQKRKKIIIKEIQRENAGIHVFVMKFAGTADITTKYTYFVQVIFVSFVVFFLFSEHS